MTLAEGLAHNILTTLQQVVWANELVAKQKLDNKEYTQLTERSRARLELVERDLIKKINTVRKIRNFPDYRTALERELHLVRAVALQMDLKTQRKLITINNRMVTLLQDAIRRIRSIGNNSTQEPER